MATRLKDTDVVIVGLGAAGGVAALPLAQAGIDVETGGATGFTGSSAAFFAMVLGHTHQGTFGDPVYGGNANYVGWDLINYPGVRTMVSTTDQKNLESKALKPLHKSAYDYGFNKDAERGRGPASVGRDHHGD